MQRYRGTYHTGIHLARQYRHYLASHKYSLIMSLSSRILGRSYHEELFTGSEPLYRVYMERNWRLEYNMWYMGIFGYDWGIWGMVLSCIIINPHFRLKFTHLI